MSTTEAEMIALIEDFKEQKAVNKLFEEASAITTGPWSIYCDNGAEIQIAHDSGYTGRVKHIEFRVLAIQDVVHCTEIEVNYCASEENRAGILAKSLLPQAHESGTARLNMAVPQ